MADPKALPRQSTRRDFAVEITVEARGVVATLLIDGTPVEGCGDTTGVLSMDQLAGRLCERMLEHAKRARS